MKKLLPIVLGVGLIFGLSTTAETAEAAAKSYKNCKELNKDYKGGVAESSSSKNKGGKTKYKPTVSKELYNANKDKDRDKDGIACER